MDRTRSGARSTALSITLPTHTSDVDGRSPARTHGIEWNRDLPLSEPVYPKVADDLRHLRKGGHADSDDRR
jgi:hypothetical protein